MKRWLIVIGICFALFQYPLLAQDSGTAPKSSGTLQVEISNLASDQGQVIAVLVNNEKDLTSQNFDETDQISPERTLITKVVTGIKDQKVTVTFDNLPFGEYGLKYFHDQNQNHKLDFNMLHIPKERYGWSNNAHRSFMPPKYADAKILFEQDNLTLKLTAIKLF